MNSLKFRNKNRNTRAAIIAFACIFSLLFSTLAYGADTENSFSDADPAAATEPAETCDDELELSGTKKQSITTDKTNYDGIAGETAVIKATAKGEITFSSSDKSIATVGKTSGKIKMIKSGHVNITINAAKTETYASASKSIKIAVYPKELKSVTLEIKATGETRIHLAWDKVAFATRYKLLKYNIAKRKYESVASFDNDTLETHITRNAGKYAVRAYATVHGTTVKSSTLKAVTVTSPAAKADSFKKSTIIAEYTKSNLDNLCEITGADGTRVPQSLCFTGDRYIVSYVNSEGTKGHLLSYTRKGKLKETGPLVKIGHANGTTYNPNSNEIYTVRTHSEIKSKKCTVLSPSTLKVTRTFNLSKYASGIAYDESNNKYYVSKGNEVYVMDSSFKYEKTIAKSIRYNHAQDIGAYNGVVLVCTWVSDKTSYVDLYRESDGKYLGSYSFFFDEIESVVVDDGYLVVLMNTVGTSKDHIFKTRERIKLSQ